jgi:DNA-binding FadR family transcriptional regulator
VQESARGGQEARGSVSRKDGIATSLREEILLGRYRPGDRLPSERDLASRSGVSRGSAREILKQLELQGLIEVGRGDGARVLPLEEANLAVFSHLLGVAGIPDPALVESLLEVHELLMIGAVELVVQRGDDELIERARSVLSRIMGKGIGDAEYYEGSDELGELICAGSGNIVLRIARRTLLPSLRARLPDTGHRLRPKRKALKQCARRIDRALAERDAKGAGKAVRALLRANREALERGLGMLESHAPRSQVAR